MNIKEKQINSEYKLVFKNNKIDLYFLENNNFEKIGCLIFEFTNYTLLGKSNFYCNFISINILEIHQNKKLGHAMFEFLIENLSSNIYAIICNHEKILNKVQIPKIFKKHNSFTVGNYELILNKNFKELL